MTDERFFAFIFACMGFLIGVIGMGLLGRAIGGDAEVFVRFAGVAVGLVIAVLLWRRRA